MTMLYRNKKTGAVIETDCLISGGGLFIKKSELARLGLRRQRMGVIELYGSSD